MDRQKVIEYLSALDESMNRHQCYACNYGYVEAAHEFYDAIINNAISALENGRTEMEAINFDDHDYIIRCKECKHLILDDYHYCPGCGKEVIR